MRMSKEELIAMHENIDERCYNICKKLAEVSNEYEYIAVMFESNNDKAGREQYLHYAEQIENHMRFEEAMTDEEIDKMKADVQK